MADSTGNPTNAPYRVLARKYRPQTFDDLIGQEPMVRTLSNAFKAGRIHQAYIFTGVRGVGKTTTARILARGLNYETDEGGGGPTVEMPGLGRHCQAIIDSRHVDVIEMDAASNTGINDVREIIESARYRPVSARYKVYIIDEVHMLSTQAFNGLLKTLEEPPEHVKFLFATTEIRKVPITVLSRCIRFDLRRIEAGTMVEHLAGICTRESVAIEREALAIIARASEGSVRDALSLLDQAIAHGSGEGTTSVGPDEVRRMLGLADRSRVIDLFEAVMRGDMARALRELQEQYEAGADPAIVLTDLADFVHFVTRLKLVPDAARDAAVSEVERVRGTAFSGSLAMSVLTRAWQILLKGLQEVQAAPRPLQAAEMVLVRLAYAADLPTPSEALRQLRDGSSVPRGGETGGAAPSGGGARMQIAAGGSAPLPRPVPQPQPAGPRVETLEAMSALAGEKRDIALKVAIERDVRLVRLEHGRFEFALAAGGSPDLPNKLAKALQDWTGSRWLVAIVQEDGQATLREIEDAKQAERMRGVRAQPTVRAVLDAFPGAEIVAVRATAADDETGSDGAVADIPDDPADEPPVYTEDDL